jgi:hypothetical protein
LECLFIIQTRPKIHPASQAEKAADLRWIGAGQKHWDDAIIVACANGLIQRVLHLLILPRPLSQWPKEDGRTVARIQCLREFRLERLSWN